MKYCAELWSSSLERGESVFSMRYDLNISSIAIKVQGKRHLAFCEISIEKTISRHLREKTRDNSEPERTEKQLMA